MEFRDASYEPKTTVKLNHNLYNLLGKQLGYMVTTGEFNPEYLQDLVNHHAAANLNVDFGNGYELDVGYNQSNPTMPGDKFKYKVGVSVPFDF